jgi:hypothetical protein
MKGFAVLVALAALVLAGYSTMQTMQLRAEVSLLKAQLAQQKRSNDLLAQAVQSVQQAKDAIGQVDTDRASGALQRAGTALSAAAKTAGEKAGPAIRWLEGQVKSLGDQVRGSQGGQR